MRQVHEMCTWIDGSECTNAIHKAGGGHCDKARAWGGSMGRTGGWRVGDCGGSKRGCSCNRKPVNRPSRRGRRGEVRGGRSI
jgi:hypothetical protein